MPPRGLFVGLTTLDLVYRLEDYPAENTKRIANQFAAFAGGLATNAAVAFAHLGGEATLVSAVGIHPLATLIGDDLRRCGVRHVDLTPDRSEPPPVASIVIGRGGSRTAVAVGAPRVGCDAAWMDAQLERGYDVVLVDGHQLEPCVYVAKKARERSVPVVLDTGSWKPGMDGLLRHTDIAICPQDHDPPRDCGESVLACLRRMGPAYVAMTRGGDSIVYEMAKNAATQTGEIEVPRADVVDTLGAGDIFHGAFCYAWLQRKGDFAAALGDAAKVATRSVCGFGTRAWMA